MQLSSSTLPVGAFAYSQGLESAIENRLIIGIESLEDWLTDSMSLSLKYVDLPILNRLIQAWIAHDNEAVLYWNERLIAQRETRELRDEDHHLGIALARLLGDLGVEQAAMLKEQKQLSFLTSFSLAVSEWKIDQQQAAQGFMWSWLDNQIAAAIKLVPLGQTDGQRVLSNMLPKIPELVSGSIAVSDEDIGASLPMLAILSAQHETQYSRLFRS